MSEKIFSLNKSLDEVVNGYLDNKMIYKEKEDMEIKVKDGKVTMDFTLQYLRSVRVLIDIKGRLIESKIRGISNDERLVKIEDMETNVDEWFYVDDLKVVDILKQ